MLCIAYHIISVFLFLEYRKINCRIILRMDIKELSRFITNDEFVNETEIVYNTLERDRLFNDGVNHNSIAGMSVDEARAYSIKRMKRLYEYDFKNLKFFSLHFAMTAVQVDNDTRRGINFGVC